MIFFKIILAWGVQGSFWTDGIVSASAWDWSNQSITWFFTSDQRAVVGNGTHYKFAYSPNVTGYQIADDVDSTKLDYICEYESLFFCFLNCKTIILFIFDSAM